MQSTQTVIRGSEHAVFSALADVLNSLKEPGVRLWGVKVSVNPSRFGVDEAISVRLRTEAGESEIGKIVVVPLGDGRYLLKTPEKGTGGAAAPELDPDLSRFSQVITAVLDRLTKLGLASNPEATDAPRPKRGIGFRPPGEGHAS